MCTTEETLALWALKLAPSHHPCRTYSLFSSRPHLPFKYFFRDPNSNQNTALWKVSRLHFLWNLAQNSPESGEYRICVSVLALPLLAGKTECPVLCLELCRDSWSLTNDFENCNVIENLNKFTNNPCWVSIRCFSSETLL